jgi:hypothetical protein
METLSTNDTLAYSPHPRYLWPISIYMAAAPSVFGQAVFGKQLTFSPGIKHLDSSYVLPQSWSDWQVPLFMILRETSADHVLL